MTTLANLLGSGGDVPLWSAGATVQKWQTVRSPADGELYTRITATGGGTTDPADDLTNYVAASYRRSAVMSSFVPRVASTNSSLYGTGATRVSPVISAGARTLLVSATGRGNLAFLGGSRATANTSNVRFEVIVDGRTILDTTPAIPPNSSSTLIGLSTIQGTANEAYAWADSAPIEFRRSLSVYVTPSIASSGTVDFFAYMLRGLA